MKPNKASTYINVELDWAESQLESWRKYVNANPLNKLQDRDKATIEQQGKFLQDTMKNYLSLLEVVKNLRTKEEEKREKEVKGNGSIPHRMR